MRLFSYFTASCLVVLPLLLSACQSIPNAVQPVSSPQVANDNFQLHGKIGIRSPQQNGSAFYSWIQQNNQFEIELSGMLGMGKALISGTKNAQVSLQSAKTGVIYAASAEELLQRATGWQAPITYLMDWVNARAATSTAQTRYDAEQRLIEINEAGWQVELSYQAHNPLPQRLVLVQKLANQQENRITMTIQNR